MKRTLPLIVLALAASAAAQTRIGSVTLTRPQPAPVQTRTMPAGAGTASSMPAGSIVSVPNGWYELRGRLQAPRMSLPAGSTVHVYLEDVTKPMQMLHVNFRASHLPTAYQMVFNPARFLVSHQYTLRATVADASGKVMYRTDTVKVNQGDHTVNLTVR